jgi:hypothetical protein
MQKIASDIKRWTILDALTNRIHDITDREFEEGLKNNCIKLRGQFIQVSINDNLWIDGIVKG